MIKRIRVKNFKCFQQLDLTTERVNVLSGINGMGKSTIIQSILLLYQSFLKDKGLERLYLNEKYVELGNAEDILYEKAENDEINFLFEWEGGFSEFDFSHVLNSDYLPACHRSGLGCLKELFGRKLIYISAYRIRPEKAYSIINEDELADREFGNNGEYALQYLSEYGDMEVSNCKVLIEDKLGNSLSNQTRIWMDKISLGVSPLIKVDKQYRSSELEYEFIEGKEKTSSYKSVNVGFGITYVLPLVITLLSAREGDIVLMENPEAHIHPAGQRILGELIAMAGEGGVQIFVETHSDHVLNGIRLAVKQGKIENKNVKLNFFYKDIEDGYKHKCISPVIQTDGRLDIWPEGFFDEWDKAVFELF